MKWYVYQYVSIKNYIYSMYFYLILRAYHLLYTCVVIVYTYVVYGLWFIVFLWFVIVCFWLVIVYFWVYDFDDYLFLSYLLLYISQWFHFVSSPMVQSSNRHNKDQWWSLAQHNPSLFNNQWCNNNPWCNNNQVVIGISY